LKYEPFEIAIPKESIDDLKKRLRATRFAPDYANDNWAYGTNGDYLKELVTYWAEEYDWLTHEKAINGYSNYQTVIDDVPIHFIYEKGKGPNPTPLILTHGWPWTFWDWHKVIGPLTDPEAHGGNAEDSFDVIIPSVPGFGFSTPLATTGINFWRTADYWVKLMTEVLGYERFAAGGGDWGAGTTTQLAHKYSEHVIGAYIHLMIPLDVFVNSKMPERKEYAVDELEYFDRNAKFFTDGIGYASIQSTRPQTLAFAMNDSPAGLCSWLLEKRRSWSDCSGDVETRFSKDDLLTTMSIYWFTQSYGTSARYYYEVLNNPWQPSHDETPVVKAPTGIGVFKDEIIIRPRSWAEKYYNLVHWNVMSPGGHFAPMEEPEQLVEDMRLFFRALT
jgi:pimeloyl-ACP methyl ester carboxylesterase